MNKNPYAKYKQTAVESASREKILLMLYEGAIKFTKQAIAAAEKKDIAQRGYFIGRVFDIIVELNNTLDHKIGGDISKNLESLYNFLTEQLTKANMTGDPEVLRSVLKILDVLYDGWAKAIEQIKAQNLKETK
ncbi:MAG: flagellar export chaperone FliS [Bdellovibrionales bacterium]|nr:flagellar export chaperone FliS [Bdellovibrionales bacterium]